MKQLYRGNLRSDGRDLKHQVDGLLKRKQCNWTRLLREAFNHTAITYISTTLYIAKYSFIQLSELGHRGENENAKASKQQQGGFEPVILLRNKGLSIDVFIP